MARYITRITVMLAIVLAIVIGLSLCAKGEDKTPRDKVMDLIREQGVERAVKDEGKLVILMVEVNCVFTKEGRKFDLYFGWDTGPMVGVGAIMAVAETERFGVLAVCDMDEDRYEVLNLVSGEIKEITKEEFNDFCEVMLELYNSNCRK